MEQLIMEGIPAPKRKHNKQRERWNKRFQEWSDEMEKDGSTPLGKCGYMNCCDCCDDPGKGRPCARAAQVYIRENNINIDYTDFNFAESAVV